MALTATFANGTQLTYLEAFATESENRMGAQRPVLLLECSADAMSADALNALCDNAANTATIVLHNSETGAQSSYTGYTLKLGVGIEPRMVAASTPTTDAVYEQRLVLRLGQPTYNEQQLSDAREALAIMGVEV